MKEYLKQLYKESVNLCDTVDKLAREFSLENTQDFINWQDKINEVSFR